METEFLTDSRKEFYLEQNAGKTSIHVLSAE